jgi:hypothetical protein
MTDPPPGDAALPKPGCLERGCLLLMAGAVGAVAAPIALCITIWPLFMFSCVQSGNSFAGTPWLDLDTCNALSPAVTLLYLGTVLSPLVGAGLGVGLVVRKLRRRRN